VSVGVVPCPTGQSSTGEVTWRLRPAAVPSRWRVRLTARRPCRARRRRPRTPRRRLCEPPRGTERRCANGAEQKHAV